MKLSIDIKKDVLPHLLAVVVFYLVILIYFYPVILENKDINQHDITQWEGASKELRDYRESTGEEGLWVNTMFGGMPAYLVNLEWSDWAIKGFKSVISLGLPHPVRNIFIAFISFYILLLSFKVRPLLAIGGAIAFGLSSYMIIGLSAGHNARIGAIAFMPMVLAGIHLVISSGKKYLGIGLTALAMTFHLRENHLQITYYLMFIVALYGLVQFYAAYKDQLLPDYFKKLLLLSVAVILAVFSNLGRFWTTMEYSKYSIRGKSELSIVQNENFDPEGISKNYAFAYSNGIFEPLTMVIPDIFGGSSSNYLAMDPESETLKALQRAQDPNAQQLVNYTSSYWGNQGISAPYYAGAVIFLLFVIGSFYAEKKYKIWLLSLIVISVMLSWGDSFKAFNYFMFDYFPGYSKFRSVTFSIVIAFIALPLLGTIGLEKILSSENQFKIPKKLWWALGTAAGFVVLVIISSGFAGYTKDYESQLPMWFLNALIDDRQSLLLSDALRSLGFISAGGIIILLMYKNILKKSLGLGFIIFLIFIDMITVDKRYLNKEMFVRSRENTISMSEADKAIRADKEPGYRVYNIAGNAWEESKTSNFHRSLGGYHGAKLRRYQELYDYCIQNETTSLIDNLRKGSIDFSSFSVINMLNAKYFLFGNTTNELLPNISANGNAWFIQNIIKVNDANEEIAQTCEVNSKTSMVVNKNKFPELKDSYTGTGNITLNRYTPKELEYTVTANNAGIVVFSEIYYPEGWTASIDGQPATIINGNYVLRALEVPAGQHTVVFSFNPKSYLIGNKVMMISSILTLFLFFGIIFIEIKNKKE